MKDSTLFILGLVAVLMMGLSVATYQKQKTRLSAARESGPFLLEMDLDAIHSITVQQNDKTLKFARDGKRFLLTSHYDYPVDIQALQSLLNTCSDLRIARKVTDDPSHFSEMGVEDAGPDAPASVRIGMFDSAGQPILQFIVGTLDDRQKGYYMRRMDSNTVFLSEQRVRFSLDHNRYVKSELLSLKLKNIDRIEFHGEDNFSTSMDEKFKWQITPNPDSRTVKDDDVAELARAVSILKFTDFHPVSDKNYQDLNFDRTIDIFLKHDIRYTIKTAQKDNKHFVRISASCPNQVSIKKDDAEDVLEEKEQVANSYNEVIAQEKQFSNWVYEISTYTYEQFSKKANELLEETPESEPIGPSLDDSVKETKPK